MGWIVVLITTLVQAIATFGILTYPVIAPDVAARLELSPSLVGYQISIAYFWAVVSSIYCGPMIQRWGAARTIQLCMVFVAAGCACLSFPNLISILVGSVLIGFSYGLTNPTASHLLVKYSDPNHRNLIFSIKQTGVPFGGILAGLLAPMITVHWGWQWATGVVSICAILFAVTIQPWRHQWDDDRNPQTSLIKRPFEGFEIVWRNKPLRELMPAGLMFSMIQMSLVTFLVTYLVQEVITGKTTSEALITAGYVMAAVQIAGVTGRPIWGWIADRFGDGLAILIMLSIVIIGLSFVTTVISPSWPLTAVYIVFFLFGLSALGWNGVYIASITTLTEPQQVGKVIGVTLAISFAGVFVGPAIFSSLYPVIGSYGTTFGLFAVISLIGGYSVYRSRRLAKR